MNIDSSNLLSMLSAGESLESIQQLLPGDGAESPEFSDALMQKIEQLQGLTASVEEAGKLVVENFNLGNQLHQIAGLPQTAEQINDFSAFLGKDLPQQNPLEKNIDLENTLETLAHVLNTLGENVETKADINTQIDASIETIKSIKQQVPEQSEIVDKLNQIVDGLEEIKIDHLSRKTDTGTPVENSIDIEQEVLKHLDQKVEGAESLKPDELNVKFTDDRASSLGMDDSKQEQNQFNILDVEEPKPIKLDNASIESKDVKTHSPAIDTSNLAQNTFNISDPIVSEQKEGIQQIPSNEFEQDQLKHVDNIIENVKQLENLLQEQPLSNTSEGNTFDKEHKKALESEVEQLVLGIESIKEAISNKVTETLNKQQLAVEDLLQSVETFSASTENQLEIETLKGKLSEKVDTSIDNQEQLPSFLEDELDEVDIENRMASIVAALNESKQFEKTGSQSQAIYQELKTGTSKENLSTKQILEQQSIDFSVKPEVKDELLQPNSAMMKMKPTDIDSVFSKQNQNTNVLDGKELDLPTERVLPKFATDIANLNRAVMAENKAEIPPMTKHFANPEWNKEIGERVIWMHKQAIPSAELRLNPGHLGPITIKIDMSQDQATVAFTAQHAAVKEAIDAALPKLREMFSAQQLNLAEVSVSQEDAGQKQQRGFSQMGSNAGKGEKDSNEMLENELSENPMDIADEIEAGRAIASNGVLSVFA